MTNELRANDYTDNLNEDAFKGIEQAALRDWRAKRAEKYLQIRRYIAILGFTQGETDAESCTVLTREGTTGSEYVLINADEKKCRCVGISFDNIILEVDAAKEADAVKEADAAEEA